MVVPLVVGTDGSPDALRAVDRATDEAALRGCPLRLVYASLWAGYEVPALPVGGPSGARRASAARSVAVAAEERARARRPEVAVTAEVRDEDPVSALLDASDRAAALIVGSRGQGLSGVILGSVSLTVAARVHCPVVGVRGGAPAATGER